MSVDMQLLQEIKTMSNNQTPQFPLIGKWDLYYHLPSDKNWDISSYKKIMEDIDSVEKLVLINELVNEKIVKNCMLFVMRKGITPLWEDLQNRTGGCFSFKVINKQVKTVWDSLFFAMWFDYEENKHLNPPLNTLLKPRDSDGSHVKC